MNLGANYTAPTQTIGPRSRTQTGHRNPLFDRVIPLGSCERQRVDLARTSSIHSLALAATISNTGRFRQGSYAGSRRAFTLVELLVVIGLIILFVGGAALA